MRHRLLSLFSSILILFLVTVSQPYAQSTQPDNRPRTASIGGRVTIGGAPARNVLVTVAEVDPKERNMFSKGSQQRGFMKIRTDADGRYLAIGLAPGAYLVNALSRAYVRSNKSAKFDNFQAVTLDYGEAREDVDIALVRGAVITGRVIDAEGRPLIAYQIKLMPVGEDGKPVGNHEFSDWMMERTDDRGVYRIYGLPAGRYVVGVGNEWDMGRSKHRYPVTYYPDATGESDAKIIEAKEGAELTGIDIRVGLEEDTYEASGRVIDAESGQPLPRVWLSCTGGRYGRATVTDDVGKFSITGLSSGQYHLFLENRGGASMVSSEHYSENTEFTIGGSDVSGLEVRAIHGSTINGIVIIEGVNEPAINAKLQQLSLSVRVTGRPADTSRMNYEHGSRNITRVAADGSFRLSGLAPGIANFHLDHQENIFSIKRIERSGAEIRSDFEVGRSEQIDGVRIIASYNNGTIRGQVELSGGKLPEGWQLEVWAAPIGTSTTVGSHPAFQPRYGAATADEKGRFVIDGLPVGEYELRLHAMVRTGPNEWTSPKGMNEVKQRVTVNSGGETQVKITLDLARQQQENRQ